MAAFFSIRFVDGADIEVILVLPWRDNGQVEYVATASWPWIPGKYGCFCLLYHVYPQVRIKLVYGVCTRPVYGMKIKPVCGAQTRLVYRSQTKPVFF